MAQLNLKSVVELVSPYHTVSEIIDMKIKQHNASGSQDAFFVCDLGEVARKVLDWKAVFPRITPFYAVKCNDDIPLLKFLALLGTGFDCASKVEMESVLNIGVNPDRIIYAHPCKQIEYLKFVKNSNVNLMTFDDESELRKIKEHFPNARLVIRIIPPSTTKVLYSFEKKYGCHTKEAAKLLKLAQELGLDVVGVSFHVGGECFDNTAHCRAVEDARAVFDLAKVYGYDMKLLDIGGGFSAAYDTRLTIQEIASSLNPALDELFPAESGVQIISEPGKYLCATAYTLLTNVISRKVVNDDNDELPSVMYYVSDGIYGSFLNLLHDYAVDPIPEIPASLTRPGRQLKSKIWGPTLCIFDCIVEEVLMQEMFEGDWICWRDMGAYTTACRTKFNGIPCPSVYFVAALDTVVLKKLNAEGSTELQLDMLTELADGDLCEVIRPLKNSPPPQNCNGTINPCA